LRGDVIDPCGYAAFATALRLHMSASRTRMTLEHHEPERRADAVTLPLHQRLAGLRADLSGRRVLVAGRLAKSVPLQKLIRYAGARFIAATDHVTALRLARRYDVDIVIADAADDEEELAELEDAIVRRAGVPGTLVRLPVGNAELYI
jgi:hypothetical protein